MKIALMTNNYKPVTAGVPISIERLARGLEILGHQVTIFAPTYEEQQEENNVIRYGTLLKRFVGGVVLPNPFDLRIGKAFRKETYDIIHVHHPMLVGRTAVRLSRKYRIPLVFTYHTRYEQYLGYAGVVKKMEQKAADGDGFMARAAASSLHLVKDRMVPAYLHTFLKHCDYVFAPTAGMEQYLTQVCKVEPERLGVLPTGIEKAGFVVTPQEKQQIRSRYGAEDMPLLLTVSRLSHEKNVSFLLEGLARFKARYGSRFRMLMVGDGDDRVSLQERCAELGLSEQVVFTGTVANGKLPPYFAAADAFLFASRTETQGIVVLEALAGATPVIAVAASGVSDLVQDGVNGILTGEDVEEYADRLAWYLYQDPSDRLAMEQAALETALEYSEEAVAQKASCYYNKVVAMQTSTWKSEGRQTYGKWTVSYPGGGR